MNQKQGKKQEEGGRLVPTHAHCALHFSLDLLDL